jgi:hypothetical protein
VTTLTNWICGHWEFVFGQASFADFSVRIPANVAGSPNASIVLDVFSADNVAGHTAFFQTLDQVVTTNLQVGALTGEPTQTYTTTSTAYARVSLTSAVASTVAAGNILVLKVTTNPTGTAPTSNMIVLPYLKIDVLL